MQSSVPAASPPLGGGHSSHHTASLVIGFVLASALGVLLVLAAGSSKALFADVFGFLAKQGFVLLFLTMAGGYAIAKVSVKGISLGATAGTLLLALALSLWASAGHGIAFKLPDFIGSLFFNLFMFAVGIKVGPQFLAGLRLGAKAFVVLGVLLPLLAAALVVAMRALVELPPGIAVGIFAGANTATPGLGAAQAAFASGAVENASVASGNMATAFAFSYCISTVLFVVMLKSLPRLFRRDAAAEARAFERRISPDGIPLPGTALAFHPGALVLSARTFRVERAEVVGRSLGELRLAYPRLIIERIVRNGERLPATDGTVLALGDNIHVLGPTAVHLQLRDRVGHELDDAEAVPLELETVEIVQRRPEVVGKKLRELAQGVGHGLYLNALFRAGEPIPRGPDVEVEKGDVFRVTGSRERIRELEGRIGHIVRGSVSTDTLHLALGLALGGFLGALALPIGNIKLSLGSVALLLVGVAVSAFRTRNPAFGGPFPEPARQLFEDLGLNVFVAVLGLNAGMGVVNAIKSGAIVPVLIGSAVVGLLPALAVWVLGQVRLKMNIAELLGAVAGARCSSPGLRAAQETAHSSVPAIAYPVTFAISNVLFTIGSYVFAIVR